jgi:phosphoglycolate phosphatase
LRYPLIVFDWDGTLFDSAAVITDCIIDAARDMGLRVPERATASHVIGLGLHDSLRHALPDLPTEQYPDFLARYRRLFLEKEDSLTLFSGIAELLEELKGRGHHLAVATGKPRRGLDKALHSSRLGAIFIATRCGDECHSKPHPAMLLELMAEMNLPARDLLMIGDTSHDLQMAKSAGVDAIAVTYGAHPGDALRCHGPRACVTSVGELRRWLHENG